MKTLRLCLVVALAVMAVMASGTRVIAQASTTVIPRGTYSFVPDSG